MDRLRVTVVVLVAAACSAVSGQVPPSAAPEAAVPVEPRRAAEALPQLRQDGGVAYVSGGADPAARAEARRLGAGMNLRLQFEGRDGRPLSDIAVEVIDDSGDTVLGLRSADAVLFAQLEPGRYRVRATLHGRTEEQALDVPGAGQASAAFRWADPLPALR